MIHNMKSQFAEHLKHTGFVSSRDPKDPESNINSGKKDETFLFLSFESHLVILCSVDFLFLSFMC